MKKRALVVYFLLVLIFSINAQNRTAFLIANRNEVYTSSGGKQIPGSLDRLWPPVFLRIKGNEASQTQEAKPQKSKSTIGLIFDGQILGGNPYQIGVGVTVFDGFFNLHGFYSHSLEMDKEGNNQSFYGTILGVKCTVRLVSIPLEILFGKKLDFLSLNVHGGAIFSHFSQSQSGEGLWLSALLGSVMFPHIVFKKANPIHSVAAYSEMQFWIVPLMVGSAFIPKASLGVQVRLF